MSQTTNTMGKLNESKFFLEKMEDSYKKNPDFNYYFSAFISAARSVFWVMKAEFNKTNGWEEWYQEQKTSVEEKTLLKKINDIRVRTTKIKPLHTGTGALLDVSKEIITEEIKSFMKNLDNKNVSITIEEYLDDGPEFIIGEKQVTFTGTMKEIFRNIPEFWSEDILKVSKKYVAFLERLVFRM
jgi:hypothetical protein